MRQPRPSLLMTLADISYVRGAFVPLEVLCAGRTFTPAELQGWLDDGQLPRAPYVLPGGIEMFPRDELALLDAAGSLTHMRGLFHRRYLAIATEYGEAPLADAIAAEWDGYLSGDYSVCLREATPENIFRKERLVKSLQRLVSEPAPEDGAWSARLKREVEALDVLERGFTACDRIRFGGPVSRERLIDAPQRQWPHVFATLSE